jgi:hypothetical protein
MFITGMKFMKKKLSILLLFLFGTLYSIYLSIEGGIFIGFILFLITIGFTSTIYILDKKIDYKIIIYIWIAIVTIAVVTFISIGIFQMIELFRNPLKLL